MQIAVRANIYQNGNYINLFLSFPFLISMREGRVRNRTRSFCLPKIVLDKTQCMQYNIGIGNEVVTGLFSSLSLVDT